MIDVLLDLTVGIVTYWLVLGLGITIGFMLASSVGDAP